jgi:hypothetical protein
MVSSMKIWESDFPHLWRAITATQFSMKSHSMSTLQETWANCHGTSTWRVNSPKITNLWTLLPHCLCLRTTWNLGQNLWQDYVCWKVCNTISPTLHKSRRLTQPCYKNFYCHMWSCHGSYTMLNLKHISSCHTVHSDKQHDHQLQINNHNYSIWVHTLQYQCLQSFPLFHYSRKAWWKGESHMKPFKLR